MTETHKFDVFLSYAIEDRKRAALLSQLLAKEGFVSWLADSERGESTEGLHEDSLADSAVCVLLHGPNGNPPWRDHGVAEAIAKRHRQSRGEFWVVSVVLTTPKLVSKQESVSWFLPFKPSGVVRYEGDLDNQEKLRDLIQMIRGANRNPSVLLHHSPSPRRIHNRIKSALRVDWTQLADPGAQPNYDRLADRDHDAGYRKFKILFTLASEALPEITNSDDQPIRKPSFDNAVRSWADDSLAGSFRRLRRRTVFSPISRELTCDKWVSKTFSLLGEGVTTRRRSMDPDYSDQHSKLRMIVIDTGTSERWLDSKLSTGGWHDFRRMRGCEPLSSDVQLNFTIPFRLNPPLLVPYARTHFNYFCSLLGMDGPSEKLFKTFSGLPMVSVCPDPGATTQITNRITALAHARTALTIRDRLDAYDRGWLDPEVELGCIPISCVHHAPNPIPFDYFNRGAIVPCVEDPIAISSRDVAGIYYLTRGQNGAMGEGRLFGSMEEVLLALEAQEVTIHARIKLLVAGDLIELAQELDTQDILRATVRENTRRVINTTVGCVMMNDSIRSGLPYINGALRKQGVQSLVEYSHIRAGLGTTVKMLANLRKLVLQHMNRAGESITINDFMPGYAARDLVNNAKRYLVRKREQYRNGVITGYEGYEKAIAIRSEAIARISKAIFLHLDELEQWRKERKITPDTLGTIDDSQASTLQNAVQAFHLPRCPACHIEPGKNWARVGDWMTAPSSTAMEPIESNPSKDLVVLQYFRSSSDAGRENYR